MNEPFEDDRFPRSARYDQAWVIEDCFGANPLWLAEWLCERVRLKPGMRVLDLGCGRAKSSIFLAKEFGVSVWASDLWIDPTENWQRVQEAGLERQVYPLRAEARSLPFPANFFDAVVAIDSYQYYGTDALFLPYIVRFLKPEGVLGFASAGAMQEVYHPVPGHLSRFWKSDTWCIRTAEWWRDHWARTGLVTVSSAESMTDGWSLWLKWAKTTGAADWYIKSLETDHGQYLGYIRMVAQRSPDTEMLPYDLHTGK